MTDDEVFREQPAVIYQCRHRWQPHCGAQFACFFRYANRLINDPDSDAGKKKMNAARSKPFEELWADHIDGCILC
jgi:hypothetical protein